MLSFLMITALVCTSVTTYNSSQCTSYVSNLSVAKTEMFDFITMTTETANEGAFYHGDVQEWNQFLLDLFANCLAICCWLLVNWPYDDSQRIMVSDCSDIMVSTNTRLLAITYEPHVSSASESLQVSTPVHQSSIPSHTFRPVLRSASNQSLTPTYPGQEPTQMSVTNPESQPWHISPPATMPSTAKHQPEPCNSTYPPPATAIEPSQTASSSNPPVSDKHQTSIQKPETATEPSHSSTPPYKSACELPVAYSPPFHTIASAGLSASKGSQKSKPKSSSHVLLTTKTSSTPAAETSHKPAYTGSSESKAPLASMTAKYPSSATPSEGSFVIIVPKPSKVAYKPEPKNSCASPSNLRNVSIGKLLEKQTGMQQNINIKRMGRGKRVKAIIREIFCLSSRAME